MSSNAEEKQDDDETMINTPEGFDARRTNCITAIFTWNSAKTSGKIKLD
jgi:hypothetical protein